MAACFGLPNQLFAARRGEARGDETAASSMVVRRVSVGVCVWLMGSLGVDWDPHRYRVGGF